MLDGRDFRYDDNGKAPLVAVINQTMAERFFAGLDLFPFLAMPFFIFAGEIMNRAGITDRLVNFADALVGYLRGGMAHSNMVASVMFAGARAGWAGLSPARRALRRAMAPAMSPSLSFFSASISLISCPEEIRMSEPFAECLSC